MFLSVFEYSLKVLFYFVFFDQLTRTGRAEIVRALFVMHITPISKLPTKYEERFGIKEEGVARLGSGIMNGIRN